MNTNIVLVGGVIALVGLLLNLGADFDNEYDVTLAALWAVTVILIFIGAFIGSKKVSGS